MQAVYSRLIGLIVAGVLYPHANIRESRPGLLESAQVERPLIDQELLEILACPLDKAPVRLQGDRIVCTKCGRRYPIREGIPVMLIDEAELPA